MSDEIRVRMERLPEPVAPAGFEARVMARIAREAGAVTVAPPGERLETPTGWAGTIVGTALAFAAIFWGWFEPGITSLISPEGRINTPGTPSHVPALLLLSLGLLCYLAGLFAPLRHSHRR